LDLDGIIQILEVLKYTIDNAKRPKSILQISQCWMLLYFKELLLLQLN